MLTETQKLLYALMQTKELKAYLSGLKALKGHDDRTSYTINIPESYRGIKTEEPHHDQASTQ